MRRSIPARAGETTRHAVRGNRPPVPRGGLSPRVRGNLFSPTAFDHLPRSIPARAGEPTGWASVHPLNRVYPRACGGTYIEMVKDYQGMGLSPRVRGNRSAHQWRHRRRRSIPARAGEPCLSTMLASVLTVYPRACGGTALRQYRSTSWRGLSPRVRGNLLNVRGSGRRIRSIPARAGEPRQHLGFCRWCWVYPRACGGTLTPVKTLNVPTGLSPRVRGNHTMGTLKQEE